MKLKVKTCYSQILYLMTHGEKYADAVHKISFDRPAFEHEGIAGYIETNAEIDIADLRKFTDIWMSWYNASDKERNTYYALAKKGERCN